MGSSQTTNTILMIRPAAFGYNTQTAVNNAFQQESNDADVNQKAQKEFDNFVNILQSHGINTFVINDTKTPHTPDSIFPNNWASYHQDGTVILYPMFAENRRDERNKNVLHKISEKYVICSIVDFTQHEIENRFLEGTGSIILDRKENIAYACLSPRTDKSLFNEFCKKLNYNPVVFNSVDEKGQQIYHTNVIMCVADKYVVICLETIDNTDEKEKVINTITQSGKEIISINFSQMNHFAGNMLQVQNEKGEKFLVMSTQAYKSLNEEQIEKIESFNPIIHAPLYTIEQNGGGSARCMMAEIFLPPKTNI